MASTTKQGADFTGYVLGKCRAGHTTRYFVSKDYYRMGGQVTNTIRYTNEAGRPCVRYEYADNVRPCGTEGCAGRLRMDLCKPLYGRFVEVKVCDGRCMGATGPSCDCSCGGKNHGSAHQFGG